MTDLLIILYNDFWFHLTNAIHCATQTATYPCRYAQMGGTHVERENFFPVQDERVLALIRDSHLRCRATGVPEYTQALPEVSQEAKEVCRKHVSGHTILIRESSPEYFTNLTNALETHGALLMYVAPNLDVYARYGSQELKDELRNINFRFGTNLSEDNVGTNAAALCDAAGCGVWTIGEQNYSAALRPYAFYAFTVHAKYNRMTHVLLATRRERLDPALAGLFRLIEATESVFSSGMLTEDVILKEALFQDNYSERQTENLLLIVGSSGKIIYANNLFYTIFRTSYKEVINFPLEQIVPELSYALEGLRDQAPLPSPRRVKFSALGTAEYSVTCTHASQQIHSNGLAITIQRVITPVQSNAKSEGEARYTFDDLVGTSEDFKQLKRFAERIAATNCTVLIRGESGTGKELFAHSIHNASERFDKPFVSINCAAIPRELIGSELFGYVGGAFTGASRTGAKGKFELADGGTLFLDEIAEMPPDMQSVLLRALEEGTITRIGGSKPIPVDVRLIAATNQKLEDYIRSGKFRLDLYYRLNIISLNMIPLREHKDDINVLADYFVTKFSELHGKPCDGISAEARNVLRAYNWPGNIRELRNAIEHGIVILDTRFIELRHLPQEISGTAYWRASSGLQNNASRKSMSDLRRETAEQLMKEFAGNKSRVAKQMGIARTTLYRILKQR